jgi:hypothetical protein
MRIAINVYEIIIIFLFTNYKEAMRNCGAFSRGIASIGWVGSKSHRAKKR